MRLFIALDIDDAIRERIARFVEGVQGFAPDARWVKPESMHVTLKFIGEQPDSQVEPIKAALQKVNAEATAIRFHGYGFFPTATAARVFWIGMEAGPELAALAAMIDNTTASLGIPKQDRSFSPHLTLARAGSGSRPNRIFPLMQEKLASLPAPEFGMMTPREFFLYQSQLSPKGSKYTKLMSFPL
jgi:RNA 2',3'-cyclic 3'-phosphodiesterase